MCRRLMVRTACILSVCLTVPRACGEPPGAVRVDAYGDPLPDGALARIGTTRWRSGSSINALVVSPDGAYAASGSDDRRVHLWEVRTGREVHTLFGHRGYVGSLAFSPDGKRLASGGADQTVRLWDTAMGKQLRCWKGHEGAVGLVAFHRDGKTLVSAGRDAIRRWDVETGKPLGSSPLPAGNIRILDLAPDGGLLATAGPYVEEEPTDLALIDTATGKTVRSFGKEDGPGFSARFAPDGRTLAVGQREGRIVVWDADGRRLRSFIAERSVYRMSYRLTFSPDGGLLSVVGEGVQFLDATTGARLRTVAEHHFDEVAAFTPDGRTLLVGCVDGVIEAWTVKSGEPVRTDTPPWRLLHSMVWSPDGGALLSDGDDGMVRLWDASSGKELRRFELSGATYWRAPAALSPDGATAAASGYSSTRVWEVKTGRMLRELSHPKAGCPRGLFFAPDGSRLLASWVDAGVCQWDFARPKCWKPIGDGVMRRRPATPSPDGKALLSSDQSGTLCLWDAADGKELRRFGGHGGEPSWTAAFSPDGRTIASAAFGDSIRLWQTASGREIRRWDAPSGKDRWLERQEEPSLSFSADGKRLASTRTRVVKIWDTTAGRQIASLLGHGDDVLQVAFSPDGKKLASLGREGTILIWDAERLRGDKPSQRTTLTSDELETRWAELGDADAYVADEAAAVLTAAAEQTVALARERLHTQPLDVRHLALIAELGNDSFDVREGASKELESFGTAAEPALRRALKENSDPEVRERVQILLAWLDHVYPPEKRTRDLRTLGVLERIGGPEARKVLERLANGPVESPLAHEAKACLDRLSGRPPTP